MMFGWITLYSEKGLTAMFFRLPQIEALAMTNKRIVNITKARRGALPIQPNA